MMNRPGTTAVLWMLIGVLAAEAGITRVIPSETVVLRDPRSLSCGPDGTIYIADTGHHRVIAVNRSGELTSEIGGFGEGAGAFRWPEHVAAEAGNVVWVTDFGNRRIVKLSRSLRFQGSLVLNDEDQDPRAQPGCIAVSPRGDIYVHEADGGQIIRFDPLFVRVAEIGARSGREFIPQVDQLEYVPNQGIVWYVKGDSVLHRADAMLTPANSITLPAGSKSLITLTVADSCLLMAQPDGLVRWCLDNGLPELLVDRVELDTGGVMRIDDLAEFSRSEFYVLDSVAGTVFRITLPPSN